jgi:ABC-type dipeptide/oligopeptide/nickel transport system ATPase subunit
LVEKEREIVVLSTRVEQLTKVGELFRALMDKLVLDQVRSIEGIVTEGLRSIFHDQALAFEADIGQKYNKVTIDFLLKQGMDESTIRGNPIESFGGGPTSVASLVLRLLVLLRLKKWPLLLLDETLAAVSDEYSDQAGRFLRKLAETTGIHLLMITHKQSYLDHAGLAYQGIEETEDDGTWSLGLRRIRSHR